MLFWSNSTTSPYSICTLDDRFWRNRRGIQSIVMIIYVKQLSICNVSINKLTIRTKNQWDVQCFAEWEKVFSVVAYLYLDINPGQRFNLISYLIIFENDP